MPRAIRRRIPSLVLESGLASGYDLDGLCVGASQCFKHIGSDTIQRVNAVFETRWQQFRKPKLRWRVSKGPKRSLGWIPFKAAQLKRKGKSLRFSGKAFRVFERDSLEEVTWKSGCFAQDAVGDWWLCLAVERTLVQSVAASRDSVGLDLGLEDTVATSDGDKLEAGYFYRHIEQKIAQARRGAATPDRPSVCSAPRRVADKMPCISIPGKLLIAIRVFSSAM